jgi:uncharacterized RDD family membrane protein YckC
MSEQEYAGFWIRLAAVLIDSLVMIIVIYVPLSLIYGMDYWLGGGQINGIWDVLLSYVAPAVATIWFWLRYLGTPGKMALKLKIVDAKTGMKMSPGQAIGRYFAYIPAILPLGLGLIWVGIDPRKQGWHDKLAGTVVICSLQAQPVVFDEPQDG